MGVAINFVAITALITALISNAVDGELSLEGQCISKESVLYIISRTYFKFNKVTV